MSNERFFINWSGRIGAAPTTYVIRDKNQGGLYGAKGVAWAQSLDMAHDIARMLEDKAAAERACCCNCRCQNKRS